jgi:hypothetical protein
MSALLRNRTFGLAFSRSALCPTTGLMHRSNQRLYSITSVRRQLNSTPSLRTVSACARSPIIVANACLSASSPRASAGTSVNPAARRRLASTSDAPDWAQSPACATIGGKTAQISQGRH